METPIQTQIDILYERDPDSAIYCRNVLNHLGQRDLADATERTHMRSMLFHMDQFEFDVIMCDAKAQYGNCPTITEFLASVEREHERREQEIIDEMIENEEWRKAHPIRAFIGDMVAKVQNEGIVLRLWPGKNKDISF